MAKLKAPLMSLGAAGQLGKALVFFGWKGLDVVREYVVPSNPRSVGQTTQRGYLADAVDAIHAAQALAAQPLDAADTVAYALWGSIYATPRTWFNQIVKMWCDQKAGALLPVIWRNGSASSGVGSATLKAWNTPEGAAVTNCNIRYGTSKTALINTLASTPGNLQAGHVVPGLTAGIKYYFQIWPTLPVGYIGGKSGIYHATPT